MCNSKISLLVNLLSVKKTFFPNFWKDRSGEAAKKKVFPEDDVTFGDI
jgi:hypothetical protein